MQETAISWTKYTNNGIRFRSLDDGKVGWHCQKVSDECRFCYAETLNLKWGTKDPFNAAVTKRLACFFDDKMMGQLYTIKEPSKVFPFDMTDIFGSFIPEHIRAAAWCVMLDLAQHTFQVLTKRPENTLGWQARFLAALASPEFLKLREQVKNKNVKAALARSWENAWPKHIWMGTSVGDIRTVHRIATLRDCPAKIKFLSCEPLLTDLGTLDLSGMAWVICGGESGLHMKANPARWMKQEWAVNLKNQCVEQGVAFYYKQASGFRTELEPWLVEADGSRWQWEQWPDNLTPPILLEAAGNAAGKRLSQLPDDPLKRAQAAHQMAYTLHNVLPSWWSDNAALTAAYWYQQARVPSVPYQNVLGAPVLPAPLPTPPAHPTRVVAFKDVQKHWDPETQTWDSSDYVYIGRANKTYRLPESPWRNPFRVTKDTPENRAAVIEQYRYWIQREIHRAPLELERLRGKILVCWCHEAAANPKACHGDVLVAMLNEPPPQPEPIQPAQPQVQAQQLTLF